MASLTVVVEGVEQRIPLESASVTLGRGLESDVRLKDIKASRRHCQVVRTPKGYQCVDLSSGNGTYVNGVQIKTQMLGTGDRITIGSTTILFEEAAKPSVSSKAATSKIPVASPPPAPSKTATAKIQVAPTRRTTARVEVAKPASQQALKPAGATAAKSGTRLAKVSGRSPSARAPRPPAEAPKKKKSPVLVIAVAAVVLLLAGGAFFLLRGKDNGEEIRAQVDRLVKKAHDEEAAGKVDAAIQDYKKALELCQGDIFKIKARDIAKLLAQLEAPRPPAPVKQDPKDPAPEKGPDGKARRAEIHQKFKLTGDDAAADWGGAVKEWSEFLAKKPVGEAASVAQEDLRAIQGKARADLDRLRKKADGLAQENKMAEAVALLKQQQPRFEGTEVLPDLEAAIKRYDR